MNAPKVHHIRKLMPEDRIRWVMDYLEGKGLTVEDEPVFQLSQALRDVCDQIGRDATEGRLNTYRTALARLVAETDLTPAQAAIIREAGLH